MITWTVHTMHAYDGRPGPEQTGTLEEALMDVDAAVSAGDDALHVDLTLPAPDAATAMRLALERVERHLAPLRQEVLAVEVLSEQQAQRRASEPGLPELVGPREITTMLGISKARLYQLCKRQDFPAPVTRLAAGPIYLAHSISTFDRQRSHTPGRPAAAKDRG